MAVYEKQSFRYNNNEKSFSSSLLDAIYRSIDQVEDFQIHREKNGADEDAESLQRAIMIDNYGSAMPRNLTSNSVSSTDMSTVFSSPSSVSKPENNCAPVKLLESKTKKSRAQKINGDLKKVKEPISPGGKIANFLNSIFSPRNVLRASQTGTEEEWSDSIGKSVNLAKTSSMIKSQPWKDESVNVAKMSSMIKSRSVNDTKPTRSCMSRNQFSGGRNNSNKSKRSVRFCPVIADDDCKPRDHKSIYIVIQGRL